MPEITLKQRGHPITKTTSYRDDTGNIHTTGIAVDNDNYDLGTFTDRDYDVRGFDSFIIKLENLGANGITYAILSTTKDFDVMDSDLVDADFSETQVTDTNIAAAAKSATFSKLFTNKEITAIRLRAKRTTTGLSSTLRADIRGA